MNRRAFIALGGALVCALAIFFFLGNVRTAEEARRARNVEAMAASWSGNIEFTTAYDARHPSAELAGEATGPLFDPNDDFGGLPRTAGYEDVAGYCGACHSVQLVMAQRLDEPHWNSVLDRMVEKQGMAEPPAADRARMIAYLGEHFSDKAE